MKKKISSVIIAFIIVAFIILVIGGLSTVIGVMIKENRLLYLGLVLMVIGFILYVILFFIIAYKITKKSGD